LKSLYKFQENPRAGRAIRAQRVESQNIMRENQWPTAGLNSPD
jgi:hypothetical protein